MFDNTSIDKDVEQLEFQYNHLKRLIEFPISEQTHILISCNSAPGWLYIP